MSGKNQWLWKHECIKSICTYTVCNEGESGSRTVVAGKIVDVGTKSVGKAESVESRGGLFTLRLQSAEYPQAATTFPSKIHPCI